MTDTVTVDMHFAIVARWVAQADGIGPYELAVYRALADRTDAGDTCWPSISKLADDARMSRGKVKTCLAALEAVGAISRTRRFHDDGSAASTIYTIHRMPPHARGGSPHDPGVGHTVTGGGSPHGHEVEPEEVEPEEVDIASPTSGDAPDDTGFTEFWDKYPATNGVKRLKGKALDVWRGMSMDDRRAAYKGAVNKAAHYAATEEEPPYAHRFLTRRDFDDYQQPVRVDRYTGKAVPTAPAPAQATPLCPGCHQALDDHDDELCAAVTAGPAPTVVKR